MIRETKKRENVPQVKSLEWIPKKENLASDGAKCLPEKIVYSGSQQKIDSSF